MNRIFFYILVAGALLLCYNLSYSDELDDIKKSLPKLLGTTNAGTEFVFGFHPCWEEFGGQNYIKIYVSSQYETEVMLFIPQLSNEPYFVKKTIPNDIIEFVLKPSEAYPIQEVPEV